MFNQRNAMLKVFVIIFFIWTSDKLAQLRANYEGECTCMPFYMCNLRNYSDDSLIDGRDIIDTRINKCGNFFHVCCDTIVKTSWYSINKIKTISDNKCGYSDKSSQISTPWLIMVYRQPMYGAQFRFQCSGSLIHHRIALSAAHCVNAPGSWSVKIGNVQNPVEHVMVHPHYNPVNLFNDVALLKLVNWVERTQDVNFACIPSPNFVPHATPNCLLNLWMKTYHQSMEYMENTIQIPLVGKEHCLNKLRNGALGPYFRLHGSFVCAGGENFVDACETDAGSPLVCPIDNQPGRYYQIGIVSWGIGCGEYDVPGIYVNMASFSDWIDKKVLEQGFDTATYHY